MVERARPLRADAKRNRIRILEAAHELLSGQGLAVPLDLIAEHAGVGSGTVHRHFPTKDSLIEAVVVERIVAMTDAATKCLADSPRDALLAFLRDQFASLTDDRAIAEVLTGSSVDIERIASDEMDRLRRLLDRMVAEAQAAGTVRLGITGGDVKALISLVMTAAVDEAAAQRIAAVIVDGLRAQRPRRHVARGELPPP